MKIILDVMGSDKGAAELVHGAILAKREYGVSLCLVGDGDAIRAALAAHGEREGDYEIVETADTLTMEDDPLSIRRAHRDCSMATALRLLADGRGDAMVSAGNTGALFIGATGFIHCIDGVRRAALASILPFAVPVLLLDSGANAEVTPAFLSQFAVLGSYYMKEVMGVESPRVGLISNGTEAHKGTPLYREAHALLREMPDLHFVGNVEGKGVPEGACDVAVCDGFTGNILLKTAEGVSKFVMKQVSGMFSGVVGKLAGLCVLKKAKAMKKRFDVKEYGGAPFLGLRMPVIKAHGNSDANATKNAIRQAIAYAESGVIGKIEARLREKTDPV
ncbi:MAG: phosphate acyltransferase PlsX [Clostridia bacterium]|nr:phosphate acyltransferase PlsX [Clostridia bacterium]